MPGNETFVAEDFTAAVVMAAVMVLETGATTVAVAAVVVAAPANTPVVVDTPPAPGPEIGAATLAAVELVPETGAADTRLLTDTMEIAEEAITDPAAGSNQYVRLTSKYVPELAKFAGTVIETPAA